MTKNSLALICLVLTCPPGNALRITRKPARSPATEKVVVSMDDYRYVKMHEQI